jgi:tetratricopeptide (TPR) repeat protein
MLFRFFLKIAASFCLLTSLLCAKEPLLWKVPFDQKDFFGRSKEINTLHKDLESGPVVVTGRSGVGKSAFAAHYARHFHDRYKVIWTLKADQSVEEQMDDFALKLHETFGKKGPLTLKKKGDGRAYVKDLLRTAAFSWLLILDNAPSYAGVTDDLPETHGAKDKHVIVTSLSEREGLGILRLTSLTDAEALAFLQHYLKDARSEDLKALAATLENHPLALLQAAAYINATPGMGVPAYIAFFTENKKAYWASESKALGDQPLLYTAIKLSIDKVKASNPDDYTLLVALSLLDTTHLDKTLIEKMYVNLTKGDMGGFGRLLDVALIAPEGNAAYRIHDYVRSVIIATATPETLKKAATLSATVFHSLFPEKIEECVGVFDQNPRLVVHVKKLLDQLDILPSADMLSLAVRLFYYTSSIERDSSFSFPFSEKLKTLIEKTPTLDPYLSGVFYSWYGDAKIVPAGVDAAITEFKLADEFFKKVDPKSVRYERVMLLANNLGFFLHYKGDIEKADACLQEAKRLQGDYREVFPLAAIHELEAILAIDRGEPEKALHILDRELEILKTDPINYKTDGHFSKSLKACALLKLAAFKEYNNKHDEASNLRKEAYVVSQDSYRHAVESLDGKENDEVVARTLLYLSQSESAIGKFQIAEITARKAINILDTFYGSLHRRQAVAHMALGDALMGQKRYKEALSEYMIAEEVFNKISSHKAFDDMSELYAKIVNVAIILKEAMVAREYALRHLETFPKSHDRFVDIAIQMKKAGYYR